jgi:4-amino-4-deoxy-L-arabinose transferase-like glycosyltransferase
LLSRSFAAPSAHVIDAAVTAAFAAYSVVMWWPTWNLPYFWDGATLVIPAAREMLTHGFLPFVLGAHAYYAHPPLFVALLALAWRVFGESRVVAHALILPFLPMAMSATYFIGARLHDRLLGFAAAMLFGATAVTLCELGQIYFDLPVAAVAACALLAWVSERPLLAGVVFALAAWMKIPAATIPLGLAGALAIDRARRCDLRRWVGLAIPLAATVAWFVYHHRVTGWWIANATKPMWIPSGTSAIARRIVVFPRIIFIERYRAWLVALAAVSAIVLWRKRKPMPGRELAVLGACVIAPMTLFIASTFLTRYALLVFPAEFLFALLLARRAFSTRVFVLCTSALLAAFITTWHPKIPLTGAYEVTPSEDFSYLDMIWIGERASAYLENKHPDAEIFGGFLESYELTDPTMGYVSHALDFRRCERFWPGSAEQIVILNAYSPEEKSCHVVTAETGAHPITRFQSNGKWLEIWRVPTQ